MSTNQSIEAILERNKRVEADKAWEGSWLRRGFIALLTYATAVLFLWTTGNRSPFLAALFPPAGYLLSTLTLPQLKQLWIKRQGLR